LSFGSTALQQKKGKKVETNPYPDSFEQSLSNLRTALPLLSKHQIPPSPLNFRTAYEYVSKGDRELQHAFEHLLNTDGAPSDEELWKLYRRFFVQDDEAIERVRQELKRIIVGIQGEVGRSGGYVSNYADTLNSFVKILDGAPTSEVMQSEVLKVIDDTRSMERSQRELQSHMDTVLGEVETLRRELEQAREESMTDALTKIPNRKRFDIVLKEAIQEHGEQKTPFCLLLGDIDHFKKFNDTYGHLVGDKVLSFVGLTLKSCVNGNNLAARYGGEEFAVVARHMDSIAAIDLAERIRKEISAGKLVNKEKGESYGKLTISIGISQFRPGDLSIDLIKRADEALYRAKLNGRNRVEI